MMQIELSLKNHQSLVDLIQKNSDKYGNCKLSQHELAKQIGKSQTWISQAIKRINAEEICIVKSKEGYSLKYTNIKSRGTFYEILNLIQLFIENPDIIKFNEKLLAEKLNIKRSTIQAAKAYLGDMLKTIKTTDLSLHH